MGIETKRPFTQEGNIFRSPPSNFSEEMILRPGTSVLSSNGDWAAPRTHDSTTSHLPPQEEDESSELKQLELESVSESSTPCVSPVEHAKSWSSQEGVHGERAGPVAATDKTLKPWSTAPDSSTRSGYQLSFRKYLAKGSAGGERLLSASSEKSPPQHARAHHRLLNQTEIEPNEEEQQSHQADADQSTPASSEW
eukprot:261004-Hanusia_phi.AAC.1